MSDLISREVLLAGLALNHTFYGLSAGTEYNISVTAATDAGLGQQTTINATTIAATGATTLQSLEAAISFPGMHAWSMFVQYNIRTSPLYVSLYVFVVIATHILTTIYIIILQL